MSLLLFGRSRFAVVTPELLPAGLNNLDSILQPYISAEPGRNNKSRYQFGITSCKYYRLALSRRFNYLP